MKARDYADARFDEFIEGYHADKMMNQIVHSAYLAGFREGITYSLLELEEIGEKYGLFTEQSFVEILKDACGDNLNAGV